MQGLQTCVVSLLSRCVVFFWESSALVLILGYVRPLIGMQYSATSTYNLCIFGCNTWMGWCIRAYIIFLQGKLNDAHLKLLVYLWLLSNQHTLKEYGINFHSHVLLKRNWKRSWEQYVGVTWEKNQNCKNECWVLKIHFAQFLKHIYIGGMDIEQAFSYWRNLAKKRNSKF